MKICGAALLAERRAQELATLARDEKTKEGYLLRCGEECLDGVFDQEYIEGTWALLNG